MRVVGDVVFTTPLVTALRRAYDTAHLAYVVEPAAAAVLRGNPHLDDLIIAPRRRGLARIADDAALARRLRRERFDAVVDLHGGPRSAWLTWATGASMRVGYAFPGRSWMYTHTVVRTPEPSVRHSVLNQWDLLAPLGVKGPPEPAATPVEMFEDPAAAQHVRALLEAAGVTARSLVVVHVSASNPFRRWPASSFVELIVSLIDRHPERVVCVISGPSEPDAAADIVRQAAAATGGHGGRILAPQLDLAGLRALVTRAAVYIGGDSGPLHVAATTATPIVELLGPTLATRSFPWRSPEHFTAVVDAGPLPCRPCDQRVCHPGDLRCLTRISPAQVVEAAERALAVAR